MECERLMKLVKTWYLQVKDEALAPARMVDFMKKHVAECPLCMVDDDVQQEVDRISRIILPPSKKPKAPPEKATPAPPMPFPEPEKSEAKETADENKGGAEEEGADTTSEEE